MNQHQQLVDVAKTFSQNQKAQRGDRQIATNTARPGE